MRFYLFFLLALPLSVMAEDEFDSKFSTLQKDLEQSLKNIRSENRFSTYPNDKYIEAYNKLMKEQETKELDLRKEFCPTGKEAPCATKPDELKTQYRILVGLENRKNDWAKEGLSEEKMKEKEALYNDCHNKQANCDKLSEADRKIASEDAPSEDEDAKVKIDVPEGEKDGPKPSRGGGPRTREERRQAKMQIDSKTQETKTSVTQTESEVKIEIPESEKEAPKQAQKDAPSKDDKKEAAISIEKKAEDKKADDKKDEPKKVADKKPQEDASEIVEEASDDEKTPRNYKPDTCRWVNDLPRKIVNGPGCGPKQRSKMCTGYVICEQKQGGAKFIRMSTCAADKCGSSDEDAVRCTKDMGYYSMRPQGESKLFMTPALKKVLSNGTTRQ